MACQPKSNSLNYSTGPNVKERLQTCRATDSQTRRLMDSCWKWKLLWS